MSIDLINILGLALLGSVIALSGGLLFLSMKRFSSVLSRYSIPFASGVLITVSFLGLIPESIHLLGEKSLVLVLLAFLGSYLFEMLAFDLHHHDHHDHHSHGHHSHQKVSVPLVIFGDTIHNFVDGVAIAAAYLVNPGLGLITAVSTFLHEVPHEIGDFGILLKAGYSKKKVILVNFLSSLSTFAGALFVYYLGESIPISGYLLAIAAGMFLYLGASDFLPKAMEGVDKKKAIGMLIIGVAVMYLSLSAVPHSHEEHGHTEDEMMDAGHELEEEALHDEDDNHDENIYEFGG